MPVPPGAVLATELGASIDKHEHEVPYGVDDPVRVPIQVPYRVLREGESLPNLIVTRPDEKARVPDRPDVITVNEPTPLSQILKPNMGTVVLTVCAAPWGVPPTRWSGLQFNQFGITDPKTGKTVVHYGLGSNAQKPGARDANREAGAK
jgi:hypothetical protein